MIGLPSPPMQPRTKLREMEANHRRACAAIEAAQLASREPGTNAFAELEANAKSFEFTAATLKRAIEINLRRVELERSGIDRQMLDEFEEDAMPPEFRRMSTRDLFNLQES